MMGRSLPWHGRPGLAGGIDKDGSRAEELLGLGFGSVEFGTVAAGPTLDILADRLKTLPRRSGSTAVGIGLGLRADDPAADLPATWLAGLQGAWPVADYLSFNLSAKAYRQYLAPIWQPRLAAALLALAAARDRLPRPVALALKLPLGEAGEPLPVLAQAAATAGFDQVTAVLPEGEGKYARLAALAERLAGGPALVAVGGIRCAADVDAALATGAAGVQVHRLFAEAGADCLPLLGACGLPQTA